MTAEAATTVGVGRRSTSMTWLVFGREVRELWFGGKALYLVLTYSVLLTIVAYVFASNSELSLIPPKEMVYELVTIALAASAFICLIIGADMVSGERERATLEFLLLTPASKRQLAVGKLLAAVTPWPVAYVVALPYWFVLSQGDEAFGIAARWALLFGSLLVPALAGLGMLVSMRSNSNRTSMFVGLGLFLLVLVPTQLPGAAQTGSAGRFLKRISPMESTYHFLEKVIVNSRGSEEVISFIAAPLVLAIVMVGAVLASARRGLSLEVTRARRRMRLGAGLALLSLASVLPLTALAQTSGLSVAIDADAAVRNTGDPLLFSTSITNDGPDAVDRLIVAMNIINLDSEGDVVDPEDWSPERTQYVDRMEPGTTSDLSWRVNPILAGDYMIYIVALPAPGGEALTSTPVTSAGVHLVVDEFRRLNPGGVLPIVVGVPVLLGVGIGFLVRRQRRRTAT